jgi:anti-anti-sigma factor
MVVGLKIQLEEIENRIILRIDGRLDAATAPILDRKINGLIDEHHYQLLLDFAKIDYLSSAGMRVLLAATQKLKAKNGALVLFSLSEDVAEIIKMAGFEKIMAICADEKEALHYHKK